MRQLAMLTRRLTGSPDTLVGLRSFSRHGRAYLAAVLSLSLALLMSACGSRTAGPGAVASPSASATASPSPSVGVNAAQLIAGSTGWVLSEEALSITSDGGQTWMSITPPQVPATAIRGVYFMDTQHGWVVSSSASDQSQLEISVTTDGGSSWSTSPLGSPEPVFADSTSLPAYVDFVDAQHGWVVAMIATSANFSTGILLQTSDAGATWQQLRMPVGGPVEFVNPTNGWLASSGQQGTSDKFYVTSNGGQSWTSETVTPPAGFTEAQATYTIPAYTSPANVVLAAFDNGTDSTAGFYQTGDNGASWQLKATVPAGSPAGDVSPSTAIVSDTHWLVVSNRGTSITGVTQNGSSQSTISPIGLPSESGIGDASFTSSGIGWVVTDTSQCAQSKTGCSETTALYGTTDSGAHWTQLPISPGPAPTASATPGAS